MPFIDIVKKPQDLSNFEIEKPLDDPTLSETFGAAFRTQNMVGSFLSQRGAVDPNEEEAGFNAIDYIKDDSRYAPYADEFAGLSNRRSADAMKMQIDREEADRRTLDAAGWTGVVAQMAAGVFDLPTLLPFGGAIAGASRSGALVGGAIGAGMDAAVSEAGLQATQATRTGTESALNIGGSIVLGGALGALAGRYLNSVSQLSLSRKIERQGDEFDAFDREFVAAGQRSVGAAERDRGPLVLKDEALISKLPLVSRQDPMIRLQLGELDAGRETVRRMAETPLEYADNAKGVATERGGSVETRIKMWSAPLAKTVREMDVEFAKYYHGTPEPTSWQRRLSPTLSEFDRLRGGKKMTYKQFKEEVGRAAYMGGEHEIPEVAAAAKAYRAIDEQLKNAAIEAKLFPEDVSVEGDISHRFRMYNKEKIIADRGTFKQRLVDYFTAGQESAGFRAEENALGQKIIEADRLREKYDASFGRLTGLEERLNARLNVRQRKMSDVERARQTRFDVMKERAPADLVKVLRGADQNAAMIDTVKEFRKAVRESKKANPKFADKYPVLARIKERGGVTKGSMLHHELSMMDVTPKKFPGLFVENGGIGELDNFVKSEYDEFANLASDGSYVDRNALYDAIREELSGRPLKSADELAAQDLADNLEGVVREWMDKVGLDANATVKDIRDFIDRVNGAEKDVAGLDTKIYNLEKEIEDFDKATDGLRNEQLISTQEAATIADELNKLEEALNEVEIAERPLMDNIGGEMAKRFEAAGRSKEEATAAARLVEDFYLTTAQRMGVDPDTLMKDFGLPEVRGPKDAIDAEGSLYQFAGPQSETADIYALATAKERIAAGENAEQVRKQTGWFRGVDEKWRYEISDDDAKLASNGVVTPEDISAEIGGEVSVSAENDFFRATWGQGADYVGAFGKTEDEARANLFRTIAKKRTPDGVFNAANIKAGPKEYPLTDIIDHPRLFAAYPDLKMIPVIFDDKMDSLGSVNAFGSELRLNPVKLKSNPELLSTVLHEVQHLIQRREGFNRGGNLDISKGVKDALEKLVEMRAGDVKSFERSNSRLFDSAKEAQDMVGYSQLFQDFNRLIDYSKSKSPSGVFRHIRNSTNWFYHPIIQNRDALRRRANDLSGALWALPKRGDKRNQFLSQFSFDLAQLLRDAVPQDKWAMLKADPRKTASMQKAFEREATKAGEKLKPYYVMRKGVQIAETQASDVKYKSPFEIYQLLAGEVEARNTQNRASMTDAERLATSPKDTMTVTDLRSMETVPVEPEKVIVVMQGGELETPFVSNIEAPSRANAPAIETEAFKRWFGDSKVVDADGKPMVVYHGTSANFESFSKNAGAKHIELPGFFLTPDAGIAEQFAASASRKPFRDADGYIAGYENANIIPAYVSIKNPKQIDLPDRETGALTKSSEVSALLKLAEEEGYDGAVIRGWADGSGDVQYVAFDPKQIKSVNNRGTFDPNDARILFQADEQFATVAKQKAIAKQLFDGLKTDRNPDAVKVAFAQMKNTSASKDALVAELAKTDDGIELEDAGGLYAAITKSQDIGGGWRVTHFSKNGFFGHTEHKTKQSALREAIFEGYDKESAGALRQAMKQGSFFQGGGVKKGSIQFGDNGKTVISLFENADKSTALHETGHYFLGAFKSLAEKEAAPKAIKADWESVKGWWSANADAVAKDSGMEGVTGADVRAVLETGSSGDASIDAAIDVGLHEQWARAFESYLRDGVAPNAGLRGVFKQFKDWLTRVYKQAKDLNVELSPELRGVFDRLLGDSPEGSMRGSKADMANASPRVGVIVDYAKTKRDLFKAKLEERNLSKRVDALQKMEAEGRLNDNMLAELSAKSVDLDRVGKKIQTLTAKANKLEPMAPTKAQVAKTDEFANLMPGEIESLADETINQILGHAEGRVPYDIVSGPRGALKERLLKIETAKIHDFVENDIEHVLNSQVRTMSADIELSKKFGSVDLKEEIRKVNDEADAKISKAETPEQRQAIEQSRVNTIRDIEGIRDRLRGAYALPSDPTSLVLRAGRVARNLNYVRLLGGMTVSAIPDMGSIVFQHGLVSTFRDGFIPLVTNFKAFRMAAEEVKAAGTALDMVLDTRTMAMADVFDNMGRGSKFERAISAGSNRFGLVSLMAPWNATLKQVAGLVTMTRILNVAKRVTDGTATADDIRRLAASGIDDDLAKRIAVQFEAHGDTQGGVLLAKGESWTDADALEAFRAAVVRDVDKTVVTPGQDKPLWMSTELGKSVGQFKTFGISAMQKIALSGLQQRDAATLNGAVLMLGLGAMAYAAKETLAGRPLSEDPAQWAVEAFDKSGLAGWLMEVNNIAEKATRGRVGLSAFTGKQVSRYASRNVIGAFLGPTADAVSDIFQISGSIFAGDTTQADLRKFRQLLPLQNLFYIRGLLNQVEQATGQALGLPETRQ